ncbi:hypothetical protein [Burkholderia contaminans]|uniref:hypothetical protein n=1 Tax=Burkholderia contaminans TaxID=488447 RepID=UPI00158A2DF7|nr:hypothetical protein [Burkholderia contaminans]
MEGNKKDYRNIIEGILTDEPFFDAISMKLFNEDEDTRLFSLTDAIYFFEVMEECGPEIHEFMQVLPLCTKEEQYELIYRFVDNCLPQLNDEQEVIDDTKEYILHAYDTKEMLEMGFATINHSTYSKWTKEQREAYDQGDYENIPRVGSEDYEWDEEELFRFRYYDADDLAYGMDIMTPNDFGEIYESESTSYFFMSDIDMQGQVGIDAQLDSAILNTFYDTDMAKVQCIDDLARFLNSKHLHDKIQDDMSKADKLVASIDHDAEPKEKQTKSTRQKI